MFWYLKMFHTILHIYYFCCHLRFPQQHNEWIRLLTMIPYILYLCRSNILFNRTNIFRDKTSFCQFLKWLLPGLKKMLILIISNTEGVKVLVCPANCILVLLKRIFDLHIRKQNEKHPYTYPILVV